MLAGDRDHRVGATYPEGGDLCRGFGSIELPALSVDYRGIPYFNMMAQTDELRERFPLLQGRVSAFRKFKVHA